ncbi:hypothetical protein AK812_SmicGene1548 [Symbiodinium microadriaticum]|uniref:CCHC-type domain-containing protein n=1 Tax=Symbiodinium microadriaticum TaxID=2951 RepID=A0A1Q9F3W0_SYMMI|nr:hypothetical protein AK812_SmicGene1548 [Symbiodinium microadriaticum]
MHGRARTGTPTSRFGMDALLIQTDAIEAATVSVRQAWGQVMMSAFTNDDNTEFDSCISGSPDLLTIDVPSGEFKSWSIAATEKLIQHLRLNTLVNFPRHFTESIEDLLPGPGPANFGPPPQAVHSGIQYPGMPPPSYPTAGPPNFMDSICGRHPADIIATSMAIIIVTPSSPSASPEGLSWAGLAALLSRHDDTTRDATTRHEATSDDSTLMDSEHRGGDTLARALWSMDAYPVEFPLSLTARHTRATHVDASHPRDTGGRALWSLDACPVEFPRSLTARHTRATHVDASHPRALWSLDACPVEFPLSLSAPHTRASDTRGRALWSLDVCPVDFPLSLTARHTRASDTWGRALWSLDGCPVEFTLSLTARHTRASDTWGRALWSLDVRHLDACPVEFPLSLRDATRAVALGAPARPALPGCRQASVPARAAREEPGQGAAVSALAAVATGMVAGVVARRGSRFTQKRASTKCQAVKLAPGAWPAETITHPSEVAQPPEDLSEKRKQAWADLQEKGEQVFPAPENDRLLRKPRPRSDSQTGYPEPLTLSLLALHFRPQRRRRQPRRRRGSDPLAQMLRVRLWPMLFWLCAGMKELADYVLKNAPAGNIDAALEKFIQYSEKKRLGLHLGRAKGQTIEDSVRIQEIVEARKGVTEYLHGMATPYHKRYLVAPRLVSELQGSARRLIVGQPPDWVSFSGGVEHLLSHLRRCLGKPQVPELTELLSKYFKNSRRKPGELMGDYISRKCELYVRAQQAMDRVRPHHDQRGTSTGAYATTWEWQPRQGRRLSTDSWVSNEAPTEASEPAADDETQAAAPVSGSGPPSTATSTWRSWEWQGSWGSWNQTWDQWGGSSWYDTGSRAGTWPSSPKPQLPELIPEFVQAWMLLQDAGLDPMVATQGDMRLQRVAQELRNHFVDGDLKKRDSHRRGQGFMGEAYMGANEDEQDEDYMQETAFDAEAELNEEGLALWGETQQELQQAMAAVQTARRTLRGARERQKQVKQNRQYYRGSSSSSGQPSGPRLCLRCGQSGHKAAECPAAKPQAAQQKEMAPFICFAQEDREIALELHEAGPNLISTAEAVTSGKAVIDCGATKSLGSVEALEHVVRLSQNGVSRVDTEDAPVFGFGNSSEDRCLSTLHLRLAAGGRPGVIRIHALDKGSAPVLLSITTLRALGAMIDFSNDSIVFRKVDDQRVLQLESSSSGHLLLPLTGDILEGAQQATRPVPSLSEYLVQNKSTTDANHSRPSFSCTGQAAASAEATDESQVTAAG